MADLTENSTCAVCPSSSTLKHYFGANMLICASCCEFFRKSVRNGIRQKCSNNSNCNIQKRKYCPKCRYDKCMAAGMKPAAVRQSRDKNRNTVRLPTAEVINTAHPCTTAPLGSDPYPSALHVASSVTVPELLWHNKALSVLRQADAFSDRITLPYLKFARCHSPATLEALKTSFHQVHGMLPSVHGLFLDSHTWNYFRQLAVTLITAASSDSDFLALQARDQSAIIRGSIWLIHWIIQSMYSPKLDNANAILTCGGFLVKAADVSNKTLFHEALPRVYHLMPDRKEFALLLSIVFWNTGSCTERESKVLVQKRSDEYLHALENYIRSKDGATPGRCGSLILLLNAFQRFCAEHRERCRSKAFTSDPLVRQVFLADVRS